MIIGSLFDLATFARSGRLEPATCRAGECIRPTLHLGQAGHLLSGPGPAVHSLGPQGPAHISRLEQCRPPIGRPSGSPQQLKLELGLVS